jgi:hypothetical protein
LNRFCFLISFQSISTDRTFISLSNYNLSKRNNPNIVPNLENYHLDENGRILFTNSNHTSDVGASTQDQSLNGAHNNHSTDPQSQISSPGGARGCGCGRGDGRGRGGGSGRGRGLKKNSPQGGQRNVTFAEQQDEGQTARVD